jgi:hypothetical protein
VVLVREEREGEPVLLAELRVLLRAVRAHAEHDCAAPLELAPRVADPAGLLCTARCVVPRVEIENDGVAAEVRQGYLLTGV